MTAFITGSAGTGKTSLLAEQALRAAGSGPVLVTSPSRSALKNLKDLVAHERITVCELWEVAFEALSGAELVDDVRAAQLFENAAQPMLELAWTEFIEAEVDPEVPGLRAPERFLEAAFRLFCKLRSACISPEHFLESALRGATQFYPKPPNLASPELLHYTKETYRNSLDVDAAELTRQYRREIDLAKILAKLYRSYLDHPVRAGCMTARDAVAEACALIAQDPQCGARLRGRYAAVFVDEAQELTLGELQFLQAAFGEKLQKLTLAGDPESATTTFRGARPDRVFALEGERIVLEDQQRSPFAVDAACRRLSGVAGQSPVSMDPTVGLRLFRATTQRAEAQFIADHVIELLQNGCEPGRIALLFRSVHDVRRYTDALLERNVPVQVSGDVNLCAEPEALDAIALLWALYDPFRHEYLMRVLSGAALRLSDASVYTLCAEPPDAQTLLFEEMESEAPARSGGWDPKHDLRLGWNVVHGDQDERLDEEARRRVVEFRAKRAGWLDALRTDSLPALARRIWNEALARCGVPGSARAAYQQLVLNRVYRRIVEFTGRHPDASLGEFLEDVERRMQSAFEGGEFDERDGAVRITSIDAVRGRDFDHVIIPGARAGSFPRWYVPEAFLYSPSLGMIAKENVGEARASRTAKFTYYMFRTKAREAYNREERRAFVYAMRRARTSVLVTACEKPTRGLTAPEFLAELQAAQLPGTIDSSDRWRPAQTVYGS